MGSRIDFFAQMDQGRANAKRDRERGGSTVRVFATAEARERRYGPRSELDRLQDFYSQWRHELQLDCLAAVEFALFSHQWEGFGL